MEKAKTILTDFTAKNGMPWPQYFDGKYWKNDLSTRLGNATRKALQDSDLRKRWADQGYVVWEGSASELGARTAREHALWAEVTQGMTFE